MTDAASLPLARRPESRRRLLGCEPYPDQAARRLWISFNKPA